jgi:hypothetical protein
VSDLREWEDGIHEEWQQVIADNAAIPQQSTCKLQDAIVHINTGTSKPIYIRQYDTPRHLHERVAKRVAEWNPMVGLSLHPRATPGIFLCWLHLMVRITSECA